MRDQLHHRPLQRQFRPGEGTEQDEPHVAQAAVGHQSFHIRLGTGQDRSVENAYRTKSHGNGSEVTDHFRKHRDSEPQQSIGAGFC